MTFTTRTTTVLPLLLLALLYGGSSTAGTRDPVVVIEDFHQTLIAIMQAELTFEGREQRLQPAVAASFDLSTIARISIGSAWRDLDDARQQDLVTNLNTLIAVTYADRFKRYNNHRFLTRNSSDAGGGRSSVRTRLERVDGDDVQLDYFLVEGLIFNVVADGVSDLSLRRAEYSTILRDSGFDALLQDIERKIADYREAGDL